MSDVDDPRPDNELPEVDDEGNPVVENPDYDAPGKSQSPQHGGSGKPGKSEDAPGHNKPEPK